MRPSCHTTSLKTGQMTRQTTRDQQCEIFRAAKIKKKGWTQICFGGKIYGVMGSSGRVGTCKIVFPLTKKAEEFLNLQNKV